MNKLKNVEYMLQFITHKNDRYGYVEGAIEALAGGCKWIQLRMKEATADELREAVKILKPACAEKEAILVIDDHVELVAELDVDGVHLGKNDMTPAEARRLLGEKYIIGATANTIEDIRALAVQDVDYIGLGPYRFTETKRNLSPVLGIEGYRRIMEACRAEGIEHPVVAIGGITIDDLQPLMDAGVSGIALSGTILNAPSPRETTETILAMLNKIKYGE